MVANPTPAALSYIDTHREDLIDLTRRLIAAPSPNPPGNERAAVLVAQGALHALGLAETTIVGPSEERANLLCVYDTGLDGPTLLLNGHLDTKPPDPVDQWDSDPYDGVIRDAKLYGLGSADMKGPDAALIYGLAAAVAAGGAAMRGRVTLALSADEEGAANDGARYLVEEHGLAADAALIAEPCGVTRDWDALPLISRGLSCMRFMAKGTQTHSSISDRIPVSNANLDAGRLLAFLCDELSLRHSPTPLCPVGPTINLGTVFQGGAGIGKIAGEAEFLADIRTLPGMTQENMTADLDRALNAFGERYPTADVSWTYFDGNLAWTQPTEIAAEHPLVLATQRAAATVLGELPPLGYFPGGTDAIWWQGAGGIPTIPGFGPGLLPNCHKPNEYVSVKALVEAAKMYALLIMDYLSDGAAI